MTPPAQSFDSNFYDAILCLKITTTVVSKSSKPPKVLPKPQGKPLNQLPRVFNKHSTGAAVAAATGSAAAAGSSFLAAAAKATQGAASSVAAVGTPKES
ncbi:hypothetical protein M7I_4208 [Glarea lozoyensis 74030]|uniref:Uncharacterized protein n=1 Tax=Glarea lozoyensis (strain ATCC 74030 / MF5533) TaxID=1104152 RepID=H0ENK1_GLAL7|nr:hypothetical protein M7I_4208 [Glarea lozoyensis 74030]